MLVDTPEAFAHALSQLRALPKDEPICNDVETDGVQMWRREAPSRIVGIALCGLDSGDAYYFTFRHGEGPNLPIELMGELRDFLRGREQVFFNGMFDMTMLWFEGFELPTRIQEAQIAAHLANENEQDDNTGYALKKLARKYLGDTSADAEVELYEHLKERKLGRGKTAKGNMWRLPAALVARYACDDVLLTRELLKNRLAECKRWRVDGLYSEVCAYLLTLTKMHLRGVRLDVEELLRQQQQVGPRMAEALQRIVELSGNPNINVNSSKQLQTWLGVTSTAKQKLLDMLAVTPREDINKLLIYRQLSKANSAFFEPLLTARDSQDNIHPRFNVCRTVSGRLSSSDPNCQQMTRDNGSYSIRGCFVPRENCFFAEFDFNAQEPRICAALSGDPTMQNAFLKGQDFHLTVARQMYNRDDLTKKSKERDTAKTFGLSVLYGSGSYKAAVKLGLRHEKHADGSYEPHYENCWTMKDDRLQEVFCHEISPEYCSCQGKAWIQKFYDALPELQPYVKAAKAKAEQNKYLRLAVSGRVRRFVGPRGHTHKALNVLIQGTAAEITRRAIQAIDAEWPDPQGDQPHMLLTVHDSIVFEIPFGPNAHRYLQRIKTLMEKTTVLSVPQVAECKVGMNWSNMGEVHL